MLNTFISSINKYGISKASHFDICMHVPRGIATGGGRGGTSLPIEGTNRMISMRCESVDLPGRQMVTIDNKIYGPIYKTAYQTLFSDLNLTFIETKDMDFRYSFERWMEFIQPTDIDNNVEYFNNYKAEINIYQYDQVDDGTKKYKKTLTYNVYDAFPINVNQLTGAWTDDGFHKLQVTFAYQRHTIVQDKLPGFSQKSPPLDELTLNGTSSTAIGGVNAQLRR